MAPAVGLVDPKLIQALQQENLNLRRHAEERDEELAAAREGDRGDARPLPF